MTDQARLTGEDNPPVVLHREGQVLPALVLMQAQNAAAGNIFWGFMSGEGRKATITLETEGVHLVEDPRPSPDPDLVLVASRPFRCHDLLLIQPDPNEIERTA